MTGTVSNPVTLASVSAFHTRQVAAATYYADVVLRIPSAASTRRPGSGSLWRRRRGITTLTFLAVEVAERFRGGVRSAHAVHAGAGRRRR